MGQILEEIVNANFIDFLQQIESWSQKEKVGIS